MSSYWYRRKNTAWDQYLGVCAGCGEFSAVSGDEDLCAKCRLKRSKKKN